MPPVCDTLAELIDELRHSSFPRDVEAAASRESGT